MANVTPRAHALLLPLPAQGHINPFMQLAQILAHNNIMVTFVNTDHTHQRIHSIHNQEHHQNIRFVSFPDGLPSEHGRVHKIPELMESLRHNAPLHLQRIIQDSILYQDNRAPPISVIISDLFSFVQVIARRFHIPWICSILSGACAFSIYTSISVLNHRNILPLPVDEKIQEELKKGMVGFEIPSMENMRVRDLPKFLLTTDDCDFMITWLEDAMQSVHNADFVIINSWEDLEGPLLSWLNKEYQGKVLGIGPLILSAEKSGNKVINTSLWKEENSCLTWLDKQKLQSVIYVGFGSVAMLSQDQVAELALGLEKSGHPFLWVVRYDLIQTMNESYDHEFHDSSKFGTSTFCFKDFMERCKDRALFVEWAPQWKVLCHETVGVFVTHAGWNSITESLCAGMPMICCPVFADQPTNARFVSCICNAGLQLGEKLESEEIACAVKKIMGGYGGFDKEGQRIIENVKKFCHGAMDSVNEVGSSHSTLQNLLKIISK